MKLSLSMFQKEQKGQIIVIMALLFIALVAVVGLAIDTGYMYVSYSRLKRSVDAAALSATTQFKKHATNADVQRSASELLKLNGITDLTSVVIESCKFRYDGTTTIDYSLTGGSGDLGVCTNPPRKLVRVTATQNIPTFFLAVVGIRNFPISVSAVSEAASIDLVLVLDRSESMGDSKLNADGTTSLYPKFSPNTDPAFCNMGHPTNPPDGNAGTWTGDCHPFQEVKAAAYNFVSEFMDREFDRIAIVSFDNTADAQRNLVNFASFDPCSNSNPAPIYFSDNLAEVQNRIKNLWIYDGAYNHGCSGPAGGPGDLLGGVRLPDVYYTYDLSGTKVYLKSPACDYFDSNGTQATASRCRLTSQDKSKYYYIDCPGYYDPTDVSRCGTTNIGGALRLTSSLFSIYGREESLWVTILLTDGTPNAGYDESDPPNPICPVSESNGTVSITCRDRDATVRHDKTSALYDADDYARDQADYLGTDKMHSLIFAIGLGDKVTNDPFDITGSNPAGSTLLNYIAIKGDTANSTNPYPSVPNYYQASPEELNKIFLAIANKIATRLTK